MDLEVFFGIEKLILELKELKNKLEGLLSIGQEADFH